MSFMLVVMGRYPPYKAWSERFREHDGGQQGEGELVQGEDGGHGQEQQQVFHGAGRIWLLTEKIE